jgi:hypothetical protein
MIVLGEMRSSSKSSSVFSIALVAMEFGDRFFSTQVYSKMLNKVEAITANFDPQFADWDKHCFPCRYSTALPWP